HSRHERDFRDARRAMAADVSGHLSTAGRETDEDHIAEIEMLDQLGQVVGIMIHIVSVPRLARAAVAAPVVGNDAETVVREMKHLRFPTVGTQRPTVAEQHWLPLAPVLVINLDAVAGGEGGHDLSPSMTRNALRMLLISRFDRARF